jgi:putative chitinase
MIRVTAADLARLAPKGDNAILNGLAPYLTVTLAKFGITTPLRFSHFIAQAAHETAGFRTLVEYGTDGYFNKRYGPQTSVGKRLGNTQPGDGARFRGRGIFQCTGRFNYAKYGKAIDIDLVRQPERAADPAISILIACEYWKAKGLNALADADDVEGITRKINGGLNGLKDRKAYLDKAKAIFVDAAPPKVMPPPADPLPPDVAEMPDTPIAIPAPESVLKSESFIGAVTTMISSGALGFLAFIQNPWALVAFLFVLAGAGFIAYQALKRRGIV